MNFVYRGKTALVTGASSGIGKCFAEELARKGCSLILAARSVDKLEELAARLRFEHGVNAAAIPVDLSQSGAAERLWAEVRQKELRVDILINNAGFGTLSRFDRIDASRIVQEIQLNIVSLTELTHRFMQPMLLQQSGLVINVASMTAFQPTPYMAVYGATKSYVLSFTEALWAENQGSGVQFLALCPGETKSSFHQVSGSDDLKGKRMEPVDVVRAAFQAVDRKRHYRIAGRSNYWTGQLPRLFPRRLIVHYAARLFQPNGKA
ncbi:SDR family oxidoreductase [Saccharibacillus sp. CPCC 101409]|uniref:SDR family NAD(P)-dependent oxidoreductase n=1 Tax=Saccharibacillus sp. CPCC 101409 TaxID=3058041 RepID=UPI0026718859|nr:SDR family oxidoreductase [Saccharibacillus sp. CPCC 101409]MDO3409460.1 SDR family oxidoreductase [Saccharibacillus sp. CPCC 101409]